MKTNVLYYGDNLDILRRSIPDDSVDLIYLDPPFNSDRNYNFIFKDESRRKSDAQLLAFEDTWHWGPSAEAGYAYLNETSRHQGRVPSTVRSIIPALRAGVGENQMMAYLVEMAARLVELRRVLKPSLPILTIRELLGGRHPELPPSRQAPFRRAERVKERGGEQMTIDQTL